jgi:hypothetical protein
VKMEENPDDPNDTRRVRRDATPEQIKDAYVGMVSFESLFDDRSPSVC